MSGFVDTVERGLWRGFSVMLTVGVVVWLLDRIFGGGPR